MSTPTIIRANLVNIAVRKIYPTEIWINNGKITKIRETQETYQDFVLMGFIDAHVHIESSMLVPSEFARLAVVHGTVATVSDPHEIANVLGLEGVNFMIENGEKVPFKFYFGAPSCVPATSFETAGAELTVADIETLFQNPEVKYLAEMMNYPGVLFEDPMVMEKIKIAQKYKRPIDGHAPGLRGEDAKKYISAGITTDHECFTKEEALDKLNYGMKIIIREGSAAKNFEALIDLLPDYADKMMFCSDDKHPDNLLEGHINQLVVRAVARGFEVFDVLQAACLNPVRHYNLEVGQLREGDAADFIVVDNLQDFNIKQTYIDGQLTAEAGKSFIQSVDTQPINHFNTSLKKAVDFELKATGKNIRIIEALDGELITNSFISPAKITDGKAVADIERDILKLTVVNRYQEAPPAVAFIKNFGLKKGAIASCVGHDSHNIIAVGVDDESIAQAVNLIIENRGGISAASPTGKKVLPLPVAGIMSTDEGTTVANAYSELDQFAKSLGSPLHTPYMTLSFMALLVIPAAKISDLGLFDGNKFEFVSLFED